MRCDVAESQKQNIVEASNVIFDTSLSPLFIPQFQKHATYKVSDLMRYQERDISKYHKILQDLIINETLHKKAILKSLICLLWEDG